jgi:hypothetical protein
MEREGPPAVRLLDLALGSCRWPISPTAGPTEYFCGEPAVLGCSWCEEHRRRAFVPPPGKARDRADRKLRPNRM